MPHVAGLRSPYAKVGRLVYFGRMLDKIRLHAAQTLPADYQANLGKAFDARCCNFLRVPYAELRDRTLADDLDDAAALAWCEQRGGARNDEECEIWNGFMMKRGWRDAGAEILAKRIAESKLEGRSIQTLFDYLDFDEDRNPVATRAWELRDPTVVVLMGVTGSGKTTVGQQLAATLGWRFRDADDLQLPANVAKLSSGAPLGDRDHAAWFAAIRAHIADTLARGENGVVTCAALTASHRTALLPPDARVKLVHLAGSLDLVQTRLNARQGQFMQREMLAAQFASLEAPAGAAVIDIARAPGEIVAEIRRVLAL